jgi:hypothetical protein
MANLSAFGGAQPITPGGEVEVDYVAEANNYTSTATTPGAAPNIFSTDLTIVADGVTPYTIEFYSPEYHVGPNAPAYSYLYLYQDGSLLYQSNPAAYADGTYNAFNNAYQKWRIVPTAGTHTYNVRATASLGTVNVSGGVTNYPPNYMRACKVVQQNDGLKPFWTPPIVTQLPSNATVGDQVVYAADATNGVYWSLYYDGIGTYPWKYIGGAPLYQFDASTYASATNTAWTYAGSTQITLALPGDYMVTLKSSGAQSDGSGGGWCSHTLLSNGSQSDFRGFYQPAQGAASLNGWHGSVAPVPITGVSAGTVLRPAYATNSATNTGYMRNFAYTATPIRVNAA